MDMHSQLEFCKPRIVGLCRRRDDGDDLYQDVWVRCIDSSKNQDWSQPKIAYLMTIARNLLRDQFRRQELSRRHFREMGHQPDAIGTARDCGIDAEEGELRQQIQAGIRRLPGHYRRCIEATLAITRSSPPSATRLGMNPSTLRTQARRARMILRDVLLGLSHDYPLTGQQKAIANAQAR